LGDERGGRTKAHQAVDGGAGTTRRVRRAGYGVAGIAPWMEGRGGRGMDCGSSAVGEELRAAVVWWERCGEDGGGPGRAMGRMPEAPGRAVGRMAGVAGVDGAQAEPCAIYCCGRLQ
jgi:hypothetical protein